MFLVRLNGRGHEEQPQVFSSQSFRQLITWLLSSVTRIYTNSTRNTEKSSRICTKSGHSSRRHDLFLERPIASRTSSTVWSRRKRNVRSNIGPGGRPRMAKKTSWFRQGKLHYEERIHSAKESFVHIIKYSLTSRSTSRPSFTSLTWSSHSKRFVQVGWPDSQ